MLCSDVVFFNRWLEGRSTFYVNNKGFIYRHVLDRVCIQTVRHRTCNITPCNMTFARYHCPVSEIFSLLNIQTHFLTFYKSSRHLFLPL